MDFTAFNAYMVCDDKIKRYQAGDIQLGYEFKCKYPTYRGAYICNIEELKVWVDGKEIEKDKMRFGCNNKWFLMSEIPEAYKEYWFTGSKATIRILDENGISSGEHTVKMFMKNKIPYTGYFGNYLVVDSECEKTLSVEE